MWEQVNTLLILQHLLAMQTMFSIIQVNDVSSGDYALIPVINVGISQATGSCRAEIQGSVSSVYYEDPSIYCMSYDGDLA